MFLGSGDLRNALLTVAKLTDAYKKLNIHFSDDTDIVTARNILLVHIMLSNDFDPENSEDMDFIWDIWYSLQWTEGTRKRFIDNVDQLLSMPWTDGSKFIISDSQSIGIVQNILHFWLDMGSRQMNPQTAKLILSNR